MKTKLRLKRILSIILCITMVISCDITTFAVGDNAFADAAKNIAGAVAEALASVGTSSSDTDNASSAGGSPTIKVEGGIQQGGPEVFIEIQRFTVQSTDSAGRKAELLSQIMSYVRSGSGVYSGSSIGTYQYALRTSSESLSNFTFYSLSSSYPSGDYIQQFVNSIFDSTFTSFDTVGNLRATLGEFDSSYATEFDEFWNGVSQTCPVILWTVGIYEKHNSKDYSYTPSEMATDMSAWGNAYASFSEFASAISMNRCKLAGKKETRNCRTWLGAHTGHNSNVWGGKTEWGKTNYIQSEEGIYYSRGYWMPFNGTGTPSVSPTTYSFGVGGTKHGVKTLFTDGVEQTATYLLYINADESTKSYVKNLASSNSSKTFTVDVTTTSSTVNSNCSVSASCINSGATTATGIPPWHDTTWSILSGSRLLVNELYGTYDGRSHIQIECDARTFNMLINQEWGFAYFFSVKDPASNASALASIEKFTVTVTESGKSAVNATAAVVTGYSDSTWDTTNSTNFNDWTAPGTATHYDWSMSTTTNPNAYAEIVANCVGTKSDTSDGLAADWNVAQGVPSTENLSIAAGGQAFNIDLSGRVHAFGTAITTGSGYVTGNADNNPNSKNGNAAITRTITFNVTLTDWWNTNNPRCSLSCSGHSNGTGWSDSVTDSGGSGTSKTCSHCNETFTATATPHMVDIPDGNGGSTSVQQGWDAQTTSHSCNLTVTYYCNTGTASGGGSAISGDAVVDSAVMTFNQRYVGTATSTSKGGDTITSPSVRSDEMCDGYTSGYGCAHDGKTNVAHRGTKTYTFKLVETVDVYAYRELTKAKVYALEKASITKINDTTLVSSSVVGQSSSNVNLSTKIWRANGVYNGSNGRVWFTQFPNPNYNNWTSTAIANTNGTTNYWLGNVVVNLTAYSNTAIANEGNDGVVNYLSKAVNSNQGRMDSHWEASSYGTTTYQSRNGDILTEEQALAEACQIVNAWQAANKSSSYTVNIISDALCVEAAGIGAQNVLVETYAIDNGISLFNYGFRSNNETYYRNHASIYGTASDLANRIISKQFWDKYDDMISLDDAQTMLIGYTGTSSADPSTKYSVTGSTRGTSFISSLGSASLTGYTSNKEKWGISSVQVGSSGVYTQAVGTGTSTPGVTSWSTNTTGSASAKTFNGYYTTFKYPYTGSYTVQHYMNGSSTGSGTSVTNSGPLNKNSYTNSDGGTINYGNALVISNIPMIQTAQNGLHSNPIEVTLSYVTFANFSNGSTCGNCGGSSGPGLPSRDTSYKARYTSSYSAGVLNDVVVHDPVSVEYWQVIGNGYGDYDGTGPAIDESGEDARTITRNVSEFDKDNYVVIGNTFHVWVTDLGDFYDANGSTTPGINSTKLGVGSTAQGSDSSTGVINTNAKGYVDNMNTGRWVKERAIMFEFPVGVYASDGTYLAIPANTWINLSALRCNTTSGYGTVSQASDGSMTNGSEGAFHTAPSALNSSDSPSWDKEFKYGLDYEFIMLTSSSESTASGVHFRTRAINEGSSIDNSQKEAKNYTREGSYQADSCAYKRDTVAVVGRIGNLALEDVGDFRFSNLFKKAESSWLIQGVVHEVDSSYPNCILTTMSDIIGNIRGHAASNQSHATLSVTNYSVGTTTNLGKAGNWDSLPLTAQKNNVTEYKAEQMRMGYAAYFDIETIGSYYGINDSDGYTSATEENDPSITDDRFYKMVITPSYYLYDYSEDKFYAIDLYAGSMGAYNKYYSSTDAANTKRVSESSLYIDLPNEWERRNVTSAEKSYTADVLDEYNLTDAAYLKSDYIGTAMEIVLDSNDLDYIGSAYMYGDQSDTSNISGSPNQLGTGISMLDGFYKDMETTTAIDFIRQSQRWYFTLTMPSSTIATYSKAGSRTQTDIVNNHNTLMKEHPNSVIVTFVDIVVQGDVYELEYNAKTVNGGDVSFTLFGDTKPDDWQDSYTNTVTIDDEGEGGRTVYGQDGTPVGVIEQKLAPLVVYDSQYTSNADLDTYGTH